MLTLPTQEDKPIDLEALKLAAEAATKGKWIRSKYGSVFTENMMDEIVSTDSDQRDIRYFVAAQPKVILALLAIIDAQNKRIAELLEDNKELHI